MGQESGVPQEFLFHEPLGDMAFRQITPEGVAEESGVFFHAGQKGFPPFRRQFDKRQAKMFRQLPQGSASRGTAGDNGQNLRPFADKGFLNQHLAAVKAGVGIQGQRMFGDIAQLPRIGNGHGQPMGVRSDGQDAWLTARRPEEEVFGHRVKLRKMGFGVKSQDAGGDGLSPGAVPVRAQPGCGRRVEGEFGAFFS